MQNHSLDGHLISLGPASYFSASSIPSGCTAGGGCSGCWLGGARPSVYSTAGDVLCPQRQVPCLPSPGARERSMQPCQAGSGTRSVLSGGLRVQHCRGSQPWPVCCLQRAPRTGKPHLGLCSIKCPGSWLPLGLDRGHASSWTTLVHHLSPGSASGQALLLFELLAGCWML